MNKYDAATKTMKVIDSCNTLPQLKGSMVMFEQFCKIDKNMWLTEVVFDRFRKHPLLKHLKRKHSIFAYLKGFIIYREPVTGILYRITSLGEERVCEEILNHE